MRYLAILLCLLGVTSCKQINQVTITGNTDIDGKLASEINDLDLKIFSALKTNDYSQIRPYLTDGAHDKLGYKLKTDIMPAISLKMRDKSFMIFDEFYIEELIPVDTATVHRQTRYLNYDLAIKPPTAKTYVSLLRVSSRSESSLLALVYSYTGNKWMLSNMHFGALSFGGLTSLRLYEKARELEKEDDLVDATNIMDMALRCSKPAGDLVSIPGLPDLHKHYDRLKQKLDNTYKLPYVLEEISSKPTVFGISQGIHQDSFYLSISYISHIDLNNKPALEKEYEQIHKIIGNHFHGITANNNLFQYTAFERAPKNDYDDAPYRYFIKRSFN